MPLLDCYMELKNKDREDAWCGTAGMSKITLSRCIKEMRTSRRDRKEQFWTAALSLAFLNTLSRILQDTQQFLPSLKLCLSNTYPIYSYNLLSRALQQARKRNRRSGAIARQLVYLCGNKYRYCKIDKYRALQGTIGRGRALTCQLTQLRKSNICSTSSPLSPAFS